MLSVGAGATEIKQLCWKIIAQKIGHKIPLYADEVAYNNALKNSGGPQEFLLSTENKQVYTHLRDKISLVLTTVFSERSCDVRDAETVYKSLSLKNQIPCAKEGKRMVLLSSPYDVALHFGGSSWVDLANPRDIGVGLFTITPDTLRADSTIAVMKTTVLDDHDKKGIYDYPSLRIATQQELKAILDGLRGIGR